MSTAIQISWLQRAVTTVLAATLVGGVFNPAQAANSTAEPAAIQSQDSTVEDAERVLDTTVEDDASAVMNWTTTPDSANDVTQPPATPGGGADSGSNGAGSEAEADKEAEAAKQAETETEPEPGLASEETPIPDIGVDAVTDDAALIEPLQSAPRAVESFAATADDYPGMQFPAQVGGGFGLVSPVAFKAPDQWSLRFTPDAVDPPRSSYMIEYIDIGFPEAYQDFPDITDATINHESTGSRSITPQRITTEAGVQVLRFPIEPAIPGDQIGSERSDRIELTFTANPGDDYTQFTSAISAFFLGKMNMEAKGLQKIEDYDAMTGTAKLTVKVAGDRSGDERAPLAGATLGLFAADNPDFTIDPFSRTNPGSNNYHWGKPGTPIDRPWATCVSDGAGDCSFDVPAPPKGSETGAYYWVAPLEAPAGWTVFDKLRIGSSGTLDYRNEARQGGPSYVIDYAYRTPEMFDGDSVESGQRNRIGTSDFENPNGFMNSNISSYYVFFSTPEEGTPTPRAGSNYMMFTRDNPLVSGKCSALNVGIMFDRTASIGVEYSEEYGAPAKFREAYREQLKQIVGSFRGTAHNVTVDSFSSGVSAREVFAPTRPFGSPDPVTDQRYDEIARAIDTTTFSGATNWDAAIRRLSDRNDEHPDQKYDVVFFITDGAPTETDFPDQGGPSSAVDFMVNEGAIASANYLKSQGTRMIGVGVGGFVKGTNSYHNFVAAIGPQGSMANEQLPAGTGVNDLDWLLINNTEQFAHSIANMVAGSCQSELIVKKKVTDFRAPKTGAIEDGGAGWTFDADLADNAGVSLVGTEATRTTDDSSEVSYRFNLDDEAATGSVTVSEVLSQQQRDDGWSLAPTPGGDIATCVDITGQVPKVIQTNKVGETGFKLTGAISSGSRIECTVTNTRGETPGPGLIIKKVDSETGQALPGSVFTLATGEEAATATPVALDAVLDDAEAVVGFSVAHVVPGATYWLTETQAPSGYLQIPLPIGLKVSADGKDGQVTVSLVNPADGAVVDISQDSATSEITLVVKNSPVPGQLPKTGGRGMGGPAAGGISLLLAALYLSRRRFTVQ